MIFYGLTRIRSRRNLTAEGLTDGTSITVATGLGQIVMDIEMIPPISKLSVAHRDCRKLWDCCTAWFGRTQDRVVEVTACVTHDGLCPINELGRPSIVDAVASTEA